MEWSVVSRRMRRGTSTTIVLVAEDGGRVLAEVARSANVSVVEATDTGVEGAAATLAEASGRSSPFVVVDADPLAQVAEEWRRMWDVSGGPHAFEERSGEALRAWRSGRFELPDYYVVVAGEHSAHGSPHPHDLHLGVLRAARPARVVVVRSGQVQEVAGTVVHSLRSLGQGAWWPPLDELVDAARAFFPTQLATTGPAPSQQG